MRSGPSTTRNHVYVPLCSAVQCNALPIMFGATSKQRERLKTAGLSFVLEEQKDCRSMQAGSL